jgi:hypothetical protein
VLDDPGGHAIGSDPDEWRDGGANLADIVAAQGEALRRAAIIDADPQARTEGDVGWVYDRFVYRTPDGVETPFRVTATYVRREGDWKLVLLRPLASAGAQHRRRSPPASPPSERW